jgi:hypothetical protein
MNALEEGQWIRWTTPSQIKEGRVAVVSGPSAVIEWLGGGRRVFPVVEGYMPPFGGREYRMEVIPRPQGASRIERDASRGVMSVKRAAAILGKTPKQVRSMLRNGQLEGVQVDGHWVGVELPDRTHSGVDS